MMSNIEDLRGVFRTPSRTSTMELFWELFSQKKSIVDVRLCSKYASEAT